MVQVETSLRVFQKLGHFLQFTYLPDWVCVIKKGGLETAKGRDPENRKFKAELIGTWGCRLGGYTRG